MPDVWIDEQRKIRKQKQKSHEQKQKQNKQEREKTAGPRWTYGGKVIKTGNCFKKSQNGEKNKKKRPLKKKTET
jgi:hypothetical protein